MAEVDKIDVDQLESYDHLNNKLVIVLDKFCPKYTPVEKTKKLFRTPLSKKILAMIRHKHFLQNLAKKDPVALPAYRKQRNLVSKSVRESKRAYENNLIKSTNNVKDLSKAINVLQNDEISNINGNPDIVKIDNKFGIDLAQTMGLFYKASAENLVTNVQIEDFGPPGPVLRSDERIVDTFDFDLTNRFLKHCVNILRQF